MNTPRLNRAKPYGEIWGGPPNGARFVQDGNQFDGAGRWLPPDGGPAIPLADEVTAHDREQDEILAQEERELKALAAIWDRDWEGVEEARQFFFQTSEPRRR
jgi:hypothetical protein